MKAQTSCVLCALIAVATMACAQEADTDPDRHPAPLASPAAEVAFAGERCQVVYEIGARDTSNCVGPCFDSRGFFRKSIFPTALIVCGTVTATRPILLDNWTYSLVTMDVQRVFHGEVRGHELQFLAHNTFATEVGTGLPARVSSHEKPWVIVGDHVFVVLSRRGLSGARAQWENMVYVSFLQNDNPEDLEQLVYGEASSRYDGAAYCAAAAKSVAMSPFDYLTIVRESFGTLQGEIVQFVPDDGNDGGVNHD